MLPSAKGGFLDNMLAILLVLHALAIISQGYYDFTNIRLSKLMQHTSSIFSSPFSSGGFHANLAHDLM